MKNSHVDIDFDEVLKRIEKEMEGYSRTEWANKVGVRINVVSNIHGASASQNPSLNYILAVSVATRKPMDYFLWGQASYQPSDLPDMMVKEAVRTYPVALDNDIPLIPDSELGKRVRYWREDMGLSIVEVSKRTELSINLIESIENGHHTRTDIMVMLADALRCSIDFLLGCGGASVVHQRRIEKRSKNR